MRSPNLDRMSWFELLLFVHIVAAMVWIGGALAGTMLGTRLRASGDVDAFSKFCTAFATVAGPLFGGSSIVVLLSGIGMVSMDGYPAWDELWVILGLVGWLVSTVMGATVVGMSWTRIGRELREPGATIEGLGPLVSKAVTLTYVDLAVRVAVVFLMVWRPG